jgi:DNA-directed RNA polymerase specialized sigma24 family protein|nr:MAG TPA: RNA polymerase sigma factor [Bacteriophage sp.]DAV54166.1 MAG TPA: RNA polymerase sigma factor [Caudoviricetes sp.]DAZ70552.1 MAG TPA: RNA polymerase sigma factor [Caudoviricetes sp.]
MLRGLPSLSRSDWEHLIDEWILSERYRGILKRKILDDWSHERIAEREGLSVNGVKKIIARCVNVLREHAKEPPG